jgi:hypothetical protein
MTDVVVTYREQVGKQSCTRQQSRCQVPHFRHAILLRNAPEQVTEFIWCLELLQISLPGLRPGQESIPCMHMSFAYSQQMSGLC